MPERQPLPEKLYYSISELAAHFDLAPSLLRYWESEFPELKPKRNAKGTRFYTREHIAIIEQIWELVKDKGFTLKGARKHLRSQGKLQRKKELAIRDLKEIRSFLLELREKF